MLKKIALSTDFIKYLGHRQGPCEEGGGLRYVVKHSKHQYPTVR